MLLQVVISNPTCVNGKGYYKSVRKNNYGEGCRVPGCCKGAVVCCVTETRSTMLTFTQQKPKVSHTKFHLCNNKNIMC